MNVLVVAPKVREGSLTPFVRGYVDELALSGHQVRWIGSPTLPISPDGRFWTPEEIDHHARKLAGSIDADSHDVISVHAGNLEIEQVVPSYWTTQTPIVHHVHTLAPTLFARHVSSPMLAERSTRALATSNGFVFFGDYARRKFFDAQPDRRHIPSTVAFHPSPATGACPQVGTQIPHATMIGFASPWKSSQLLMEALQHVTAPLDVTIAGPFWKDEFNFTHSAVGPVRVTVDDRYLTNDAQIKVLNATSFGLFPYVEHPSFQGSGALPLYLANGVPVVTTDVANLPEMVRSAGLSTTPDARSFADAINVLAGDASKRSEYAASADGRKQLFSIETHVAESLQLFTRIIGRDVRFLHE